MADIRSRAAGYSDPRLGVAFESLADVFAPPSGQSMYGYAHAASEKAKAQRLGDVWAMRDNPDQAVRDRAAIAAGLYNPNQSYYAVDTKDVTDRRGQDITSSDRRYDVNSRDTTAIATNKADNQRHMDVAMVAPVAKDATRFVPQNIADMYSVPTTQTGVVAAQPGEKNYLPDGRVLEGNVKPRTESEVKGQIIADMTPEERRAIGYGDTPVVETDKGPMTRPQQLQSGTPAQQKDANTVYNYLTPDGQKGGTAVLRGMKLYDSQTGALLPPNTRVQAASAAQGKEGALGPTTANQTDANKRAAQLDVFDALLNEHEATLKANPGIVGAPGSIRGAAQNAVSAVQEFAQAFGNVAPEAKIAEDQVRSFAEKIGATTRDPNIARAKVQQYDIAYKLAQMQNPTGEVSRQAFERALDTVAGGALSNNQSALEAVTALREGVKRERGGVDALRNPTAKPGAPAPATPVARPRFTNPTTKEVIEWDGTKYVPVQ
jgi:hypothetical protein